MWKEFIFGVKEVFIQTEKTRQNTEDIKEV